MIDEAAIHPISGIRIAACASATSGSTHAELVPAVSTNERDGPPGVVEHVVEQRRTASPDDGSP
jgi:hypothetical protein